jgi:hypothetical protein
VLILILPRSPNSYLAADSPVSVRIFGAPFCSALPVTVSQQDERTNVRFDEGSRLQAGR